MSSNSSSATDIARRAILKIDESNVMSMVDGLDLRGHTKISAVVGMPQRTLQQRRDVATFAATAPIAAIQALLELLAMAPLEKVIAALGDHADTPNYDQLVVAVDAVAAEGASVNDIVAVLGFAVAEEFPAAPHCRRLLDERPELNLPELPDLVATSTLLSPKEIDPEVREARRRRREEEKKRKRGPVSARPPRPSKAKPPASTPTVTKAPVMSVDSGYGPARRRLLLTPAESERFDCDHPLAGTVVIVDVPFDALDPLAPEQTSKERPAVVVAANDDAMLVRPVYSATAPTRTVFSAWRRLGLDHVCYVDDARVALSLNSAASPERVGRLTDEEWNSLF
jgi:hypothetical protein